MLVVRHDIEARSMSSSEIITISYIEDELADRATRISTLATRSDQSFGFRCKTYPLSSADKCMGQCAVTYFWRLQFTGRVHRVEQHPVPRDRGMKSIRSGVRRRH